MFAQKKRMKETYPRLTKNAVEILTPLTIQREARQLDSSHQGAVSVHSVSLRTCQKVQKLESFIREGLLSSGFLKVLAFALVSKGKI